MKEKNKETERAQSKAPPRVELKNAQNTNGHRYFSSINKGDCN